jgi:hypothetical protein
MIHVFRIRKPHAMSLWVIDHIEHESVEFVSNVHMVFNLDEITAAIHAIRVYAEHNPLDECFIMYPIADWLWERIDINDIHDDAEIAIVKLKINYDACL